MMCANTNLAKWKHFREMGGRLITSDRYSRSLFPILWLPDEAWKIPSSFGVGNLIREALYDRVSRTLLRNRRPKCVNIPCIFPA